MKKLINLRVLSVAAFSFLFAYILSFAFEGKVLYSLLEHYSIAADTYILSAIVAHFAGLFSCGAFVKSPQMAKRVMLVGMLLCLIVTIPFFFAPSILWLIGLVIAVMLVAVRLLHGAIL